MLENFLINYNGLYHFVNALNVGKMLGQEIKEGTKTFVLFLEFVIRYEHFSGFPDP